MTRPVSWELNFEQGKHGLGASDQVLQAEGCGLAVASAAQPCCRSHHIIVASVQGLLQTSCQRFRPHEWVVKENTAVSISALQDKASGAALVLYAGCSRLGSATLHLQVSRVASAGNCIPQLLSCCLCLRVIRKSAWVCLCQKASLAHPARRSFLCLCIFIASYFVQYCQCKLTPDGLAEHVSSLRDALSATGSSSQQLSNVTPWHRGHSTLLMPLMWLACRLPRLPDA